MTRHTWVIALAMLGTGCVSEKAKEVPLPRDVAVWDFPPGPENVVARLFPPEESRVQRMRRQVRSEVVDEKLTATVLGKDPFFSFQLSASTVASSARVEIESNGGGRFQVFWTSSDCPVFSEQCSASADVPGGHQTVSFLLDPTRPMRALRLDLPEQPEARFAFPSIALVAGGTVRTSWTSSIADLEVEPSESGLLVRARSTDPCVVAPTPGLVAERVKAIEVTVHGPPGGLPRLYWAGACPNFSEDCAVDLLPADAGALTHRGELGKSARWRGPVPVLRFDPGANAGDYFIEHVALVRE